MQLRILRTCGRLFRLRSSFGNGAEAEDLLFFESKGRGGGKREARRIEGFGKRAFGKSTGLKNGRYRLRTKKSTEHSASAVAVTLNGLKDKANKEKA